MASICEKSIIENNDTIKLMKLFGENVKQDITNTSDIIKLIEERIKNFDTNLLNLKSSTSDLNNEFNNFTNKMENLNATFKEIYEKLNNNDIDGSSYASGSSGGCDSTMDGVDIESDSDDSYISDITTSLSDIKRKPNNNKYRHRINEKHFTDEYNEVMKFLINNIMNSENNGQLQR